MLRAGGCGPVHVVLGAAADEVRGQADLSGCVIVTNPRWEEGMGTSLRAGLASLAGHEQDAETPDTRRAGSAAGAGHPGAAVICLVDQPGVGAEAVARVLAAARAGEDLPSALVSAVYGAQRGHPVLFGSSRWAAVAGSAGGDRGARRYLREHAEQTLLVECGDVADPADIDTPADLRILDETARGATER